MDTLLNNKSNLSLTAACVAVGCFSFSFFTFPLFPSRDSTAPKVNSRNTIRFTPK